jgi:hypothetical protein
MSKGCCVPKFPKQDYLPWTTRYALPFGAGRASITYCSA